MIKMMVKDRWNVGMEFYVVQVNGDDELHIVHDSWLFDGNQVFLCTHPENPLDKQAWKKVKKTAEDLVYVKKKLGGHYDFESAQLFVNAYSSQPNKNDQLQRLEAVTENLQNGQNALLAMAGGIKNGVKVLVARPAVVAPIRRTIPQLPKLRIENEAGYNALKGAMEVARHRNTVTNSLRAKALSYKQNYLAKMFELMFTDEIIGRIARDEFGPFVGTRVYFAIAEIFAERRPNYDEQQVAQSIAHYLTRNKKK